MLTGIAYQITREDNNEVLFEGIVGSIHDTICPAQESRWLTKEFPNLPSECELLHFNVKGLKLDIREFSIPWELVKDNPGPRFSGF